MVEDTRGEWAALRETILATPELRREYEHTREAVLQTRRLLQQLDAERERAGLSKAALAERIGADASVVRRLFSSRVNNPTLKTVVEIAGVLGLKLDLQPSHSVRPTTRRTRRRPAAA